MIIGSASGPRSDWYDRNPVAQYLSGSTAAIAPGATGFLFQYTVPAGRKASVATALARVHRDTAATILGIASANVRAFHGAANSQVVVALINTNGVNDTAVMNVGTNLVLSAGDTLSADSVDTSTNGTVDYLATATLTEFDG